MKRMIRANARSHDVIFEDEYFEFIRTQGIGIDNTPWTGLAVLSKGLADKHVVEIRLNRKGFPDMDGNPVEYKYTNSYIAHGMRSSSDTLEETEEYIDVLEDAVDFARKIDSWLYNNGGESIPDTDDYDLWEDEDWSELDE